MFVIIYNGQVILGPMAWKQFFFQSVILDDCGIEVTLPITNEGVYVVNDEITIMPAVYTYDPLNSLTQKSVGPFWTFTDTLATGNFIAVDKDINHIQVDLKDLVSKIRWQKEVSGITVTINDNTYSIDTTRDGRNLYYTSLQLNAPTYNWKFREGYATITNTDLQNIVTAINQHVQDCFTEEANRITEIMSKTTAEDLEPLFASYNPPNSGIPGI